jgi:hypothetical protein
MRQAKRNQQKLPAIEIEKGMHSGISLDFHGFRCRL